MTLWYFPLEPLDERYTECWSRWFPETFQQYNIDFVNVPGDTLTDKIEEGEFLDCFGRPYFALSQIQKFIKLWRNGDVKSGDKLFFTDLWHHGFEVIPYIRDLADRKIEIYGIFHAGSYDPHDFLAQKTTGAWASQFERMVCRSITKIFVGSEWSKQLLTRGEIMPKIMEEKVIVTGLPLKSSSITDNIFYMKKSENPKYVVFPHRLAPEKGLDRMIKIMTEVFDKSDDIALMITSGRPFPLHCRDPALDKELHSFLDEFIKFGKICLKTGLSKVQYYRNLVQCKVVLSTAYQETFGYGVLESMLCGCTPVVPGNLSYTDFLDDRFFYNSIDEAVDKILNFCENPVDVSRWAEHYESSNVIGKMLKEMGLV